MLGSESPEDYFKERFGVQKSFFQGLKFFERSGDYWLVSESLETGDKFIASGIRALRDTGIGVKPTSYILQIIGDSIKKNVVELDREQLKKLVFNRERLETELERGYVALRFRNHIIGCGLATRKGLETQIPKSRAKELEAVLED